jgi:hypothetical protein
MVDGWNGSPTEKTAAEPIIAPRRAPAFAPLRPPRAGEFSVLLLARGVDKIINLNLCLD